MRTSAGGVPFMAYVWPSSIIGGGSSAAQRDDVAGFVKVVGFSWARLGAS